MNKKNVSLEIHRFSSDIPEVRSDSGTQKSRECYESDGLLWGQCLFFIRSEKTFTVKVDQMRWRLGNPDFRLPRNVIFNFLHHDAKF